MMKRKRKLPWRELPKHETHEYLSNQPDLPPEEMLPDLGAYAIEQHMPTPCRFPLCQVWVLTPTGEQQTDVVFVTQIGEQQYLGTVIVPEEMEAIQAAMSTQFIRVTGTPRPDEAYTTPVGETVIPFRGTFEPIPEELVMQLSMN